MKSALAAVASLALAAVSLGCSQEVDPSSPTDETNLGTSREALSTQSWPFDKAYGEGVLSPMPTTRTEVSNGFLGWKGAIQSTIFGPIQLPAFETKSNGAGAKVGKVHFVWNTFTAPEHGNYRIVSPSPIRIRGRTHVEGSGNYFTSNDATASVHLDLKVEVCFPNYPCSTYHSDHFIADDRTKSENRTKSFSEDVYFSELSSFGVFAGTYIHVEAILTTYAWSNSDGEASVGITELGIATSATADTIVHAEW
jgi:hypothetical protein